MMPPKKKRQVTLPAKPGKVRQYLADNFTLKADLGEFTVCKIGHVLRFHLENGSSNTKTANWIIEKFGFQVDRFMIKKLADKCVPMFKQARLDTVWKKLEQFCQDAFVFHFPPKTTVHVAQMGDPVPSTSVPVRVAQMGDPVPPTSVPVHVAPMTDPVPSTSTSVPSIPISTTPPRKLRGMEDTPRKKLLKRRRAFLAESRSKQSKSLRQSLQDIRKKMKSTPYLLRLVNQKLQRKERTIKMLKEVLKNKESSIELHKSRLRFHCLKSQIKAVKEKLKEDEKVTADKNKLIASKNKLIASKNKVIANLQADQEEWDLIPPHIIQIFLSSMTKRGLVTDENIIHFIDDKLRVLDLSASEISDTCLFNLSVCQSLCELNVNSNKACNTAITSAGVSSVSRSCPQLQVLYLRCCVNLTDDGVIAVSQNCPMLRELNIGGCPRITDASLVALGQNSRHLVSLNFAKAAVTDMGVTSLVSGVCSSSLKEVDMSECVHLTDEAVESVFQLCRQTKIVFHGCPLITENARIAVEELMHDGSSSMKQVTSTVC